MIHLFNDLILTYIIVFVFILLIVAIITILERTILAIVQRRYGPINVAINGIFQPIADATKLIINQIIIPIKADFILFFISPIIALFSSLFIWAIIPVNEYFVFFNYNTSILILLIVNSIEIYGIIFAGWSANNKYTFISIIRSINQLISYEIAFNTIIVIIIFINNSFNFYNIIINQIYISNCFVFIFIYILYWISIIAENGRTPFDIIEAESELVSGYMTEHSSLIFVFFFLAEYSNILASSFITTILFYKGYIFNFTFKYYWFDTQSIVFSIKTIVNIYIFILIRAILPRVKFNQLITFSWIYIIPTCFGFIYIAFSIIHLFVLYLLY